MSDVVLEPANVDLALEQAGGNFTLAGTLLDVSRHQVYYAVQNNPTLKARWGNPDGNQTGAKRKPMPAPDEDVQFHREVLPPVPGDVLETEVKIAKAAVEEEKILADEKDAVKGLEKMGFGQDLIDLAMGCQRFAAKHYRKLSEMQSGGINLQFFRVLQEINRINDRLAEVGKEGGPDMQEQMMLRIDRKDLLKWLAQARDSTAKAFLIDAKVSQMMKEQKPRKERPGSFLDIKSANATA